MALTLTLTLTLTLIGGPVEAREDWPGFGEMVWKVWKSRVRTRVRTTIRTWVWTRVRDH